MILHLLLIPMFWMGRLEVLIYSIALSLFVTHLILGWKKLVPADAMQIPRDHQTRVIYIGWLAALAIAFMRLAKWSSNQGRKASRSS